MAQTLYYAGEVALWLQRACGDALEFLGCHNLSGVTVPRGDTTPSYCRVGKNQYSIQRTRKGTPGLGVATVVAYDTILNLLQELPCPFNLFTMYSACGSDDDPFNYDYFYIYEGMEPTSESTDTVVAGISPEQQVEILLSMPTTFRTRTKVKSLTSQDVDVSAITALDIGSIAFCDDVECGDLCGDASVGCQHGWFGTFGTGTNVLGHTVDGGSTWASVANPFTTATDRISDIACDGDVIIVADGTDSRYAYSWDDGTTWTEVLTPTKIINDIFMLGATKIWMAANDGYIYYSSNRGASVTTQSAGGATASTLLSIDGASSLLLYAVGEDNAFVRTEDGGDIWTAVTGPAIGIFPNDLYVVKAVPGTNIVFVGDEQGHVYRSEDKGDTWTTVIDDYTNLAGGIQGIAVPHCDVVAVIGNSSDPYFYPGAVGYMYQSIDGGASWQGIELPSNTGVRDIYACSVSKYWIVGDSGYVALVSGPSI